MNWLFGWWSRWLAKVEDAKRFAAEAAEKRRADRIESGIAVGPARVVAVHCALPDWPDWGVYLKVCGRWERIAKRSTFSMAIDEAKFLAGDLKVAERLTEAKPQ